LLFLRNEVIIMPRPRKWRNICSLPDTILFGPIDTPINYTNFIQMTIEEYEAIRLIDLEGFTQEECAHQMNIARTTVQGIYSEARKKVADLLVNGKNLKIEGGDYKLCDGYAKSCGDVCRRHRHGRRQ